MHAYFSSDSPLQEPPFLAGIATFLLLVLNPDPHPAGQAVQSDHSDQRQSVGRREIVTGDNVVASLPFSPVKLPMQVLLSAGSSDRVLGQVHM